MSKQIKKHQNTIVVGFDDVNDPARRELIKLLNGGKIDGDMPDWVLFTAAYNILDDKNINVGDEFRNIQNGHSIEVLNVTYDLGSMTHIVLCDDDSRIMGYTSVIKMDELLDVRLWAKMNQLTEVD